MKRKIRFSLCEKLKFQRDSGDNNPVHWDERFTSDTIFAEPIHYGVASFLKIFNLVQDSSKMKFNSVSVSFNKPINNYNFTYEIEEINTDKQAIIRLKKGASVYITISAIKQKQLNSVDHTSFFLYLSQYFGNIDPGPGAIINQLDLTLPSRMIDLKLVKIQRTDLTIDETTKYLIFVKEQIIGSSLVSKVKHFSNPIIKGVTNLSQLTKAKILITGASQGLGNCLFQLLAQSNVHMVLTYNNGLNKIKETISKVNPAADVSYVEVDLSSSEDSIKLKDYCTKEKIIFDYIFLNATTKITRFRRGELNDKELKTEINKLSSCTINTFNAVCGSLKKDSHIVHISSNYVLSPQNDFEHYIASKAECDQYIRGMIQSSQSLITYYPDKFYSKQSPNHTLKKSSFAQDEAKKILFDLLENTK